MVGKTHYLCTRKQGNDTRFRVCERSLKEWKSKQEKLVVQDK